MPLVTGGLLGPVGRLLTGGLGSRPVVPPGSLAQRDMHVWRAIVHAISDTDAFDAVLIGERPSGRGQFGADRTPAAIVTPTTGAELDAWDDFSDVEPRVDGAFFLTIVVRDEDAARRFATLDRLRQVASNAISGRSLAGLTVAGLTRLRSWTFEGDGSPEKHLVIRGEYAYLVPGDTARDESEEELSDF